MPAASENRNAVIRCLRAFLASTGRVTAEPHDRVHLMRDLALKSDEGVDFVLDLCDEFEFDFPKDFNPFVNEAGTRGHRVGEMVDAIVALLPAKEFAK